MFVGLALMASATCRKSVSMPIGVVVLCVSFNQHSTSNKGCENRTGSSGLIGWIGPASGLSRLQNRSAHEPIIEPENRKKTETGHILKSVCASLDLSSVLVEKVVFESSTRFDGAATLSTKTGCSSTTCDMGSEWGVKFGTTFFTELISIVTWFELYGGFG
jgi:hypothetical protein